MIFCPASVLQKSKSAQSKLHDPALSYDRCRALGRHSNTSSGTANHQCGLHVFLNTYFDDILSCVCTAEIQIGLEQVTMS